MKLTTSTKIALGGVAAAVVGAVIYLMRGNAGTGSNNTGTGDNVKTPATTDKQQTSSGSGPRTAVTPETGQTIVAGKTLVRVKGAEKVWYIDKDFNRHHVKSREGISKLGLNINNTLNLTLAELEAFPAGANIAGLGSLFMS